jgi:hypothetical protein
MNRKAFATCIPFFIASLSLVCQLGISGPPQVPLKVEEALGVLTLAGRMPIAMSPDGELVAYTLKDDRKLETTQDERYSSYTRTGAFTEGLGCDVWITNTRSGQSRNLTEGQGTSSSPVWSPDGKYLAFSDRSGTFHVWLWERASGRIRQLSDAIPRPFFNFQVVRWTPDSRYVLAKVLPEGMTVEQAADLMTPPSATASKAAQPTAVTVTVFSSSAAGEEGAPGTPSEKPVADESWMNRYMGDLALIEAATGRVDHITTGIKPLGYWISPDGAHIACMNWRGRGERSSRVRVEVLSLADRASRVLVPKLKQDYGISVSWAPTVARSRTDVGRRLLHRSTRREPKTSPPARIRRSMMTTVPALDASGGWSCSSAASSTGGRNQPDLGGLARLGIGETTCRDPDRVVRVLAPVGGGRFWSPDGRS